MPLKPRMLHMLTLTALLSGAASVWSDDAPAGDPPLRVGRISYMQGLVSMHTADEDEWSYARLNYPVVAGDAFWTEPDARSEIQIGSVEIRMDHATQMHVQQLDEDTTQLNVPQGTVNIHFATPPLSGSVEVLTPAGPIELSQPGTYHIDSGQPTAAGTPAAVTVTALEGQLEIRSPRSLLEVMPGETALLSGNPPTFSLQEANPTPFDDWALARERREEAHATAQYVSSHVTGYEDLDNYGSWAADPAYGNIWYPATIQADWAPYRYGEWAYVAPWGWTWVDSAPWGFAPFHYGRWAYVDNRWGWVPGTIVPRPAYAPALVAFIGGANWNIIVSGGGSGPAVGWVPLGPREVFHPYYRSSVEYVRNVNITNINRTEINNITNNNIQMINAGNYANRNGTTVVPVNTFRQGQSVHQSVLPVSHEQLAHTPVALTLAHLPPPQPARIAGHVIAPAAQAQMPHPQTQSEPRKIAVNPVQSSIAPQEPHAPEAPRPPSAPQIVHVTPHEISSGGQHHEERQTGENAPGPEIHHAPAQERTFHIERINAPAQEQPLPKAQVQHPQQQTHIMPTPQGWQRVPEHHKQPHRPETHGAPHPSAGQEQHKREDLH